MSGRKINLHLAHSDSLNSNQSDRRSSVTEHLTDTNIPLNKEQAKETIKIQESIPMKSVEKIKHILKNTSNKLNSFSNLNKDISLIQEIQEKNNEILKLQEKIKELEIEK